MGPGVVNKRQLTDTAPALVGCGRGLLAMDESNGTCNRRNHAALRGHCGADMETA
jgi:hypothetical protein